MRIIVKCSIIGVFFIENMLYLNRKSLLLRSYAYELYQRKPIRNERII